MSKKPNKFPDFIYVNEKSINLCTKLLQNLFKLYFFKGFVFGHAKSEINTYENKSRADFLNIFRCIFSVGVNFI